MLPVGEVAPAAPALGPLVVIAVCLFAFAFVWTVRQLMQALFGWLISILESIPAIGGKLAAPFKAAEQAVANSLGRAEASIDHTIGAAWHLLARYMDWLWREIRGHAVLLADITAGIVPLANAYHALRNLAHGLERRWHGIEAGVKTLTKQWHGIERRVHALERELAKGIGHDLRIHIKALDKELAHVENDVIPAIRAEERTAAAAIDNLYEWAKGKASLLGIGTFATAVATALGLEAWNLLRCSVFRNMWGRRGCGLWSDLESLLGLFVDTLLLTNICTILPWLETAVSDVADPIVVALTDVGAGLCSGGIGPAPTLHVPALSLPANPGITLNLP